MSSILKPPLGMRKHMDTTHSPQSSLVHECQNLTNPPPHGQNWCNKKQQIPHPLGHKKVPKPLVTPINAPYFPGVGGGGGFNWQVHKSEESVFLSVKQWYWTLCIAGYCAKMGTFISETKHSGFFEHFVSSEMLVKKINISVQEEKNLLILTINR